jgi:hypothetical protein
MNERKNFRLITLKTQNHDSICPRNRTKSDGFH